MKPTLLIAGFMLAGCAAASPQPVPLATGSEPCGNCRMVVASLRPAGPIGAPGELPIFFDDIACLREYLAGHDLADGAATFVADYDTGEWIAYETAAIVRAGEVTPMGSGLVARQPGAGP